jgi:hypothetical protein
MKTCRRQAAVAAAKPGEHRALFFPSHQEGRVTAALERGIGKRDACFGFGVSMPAELSAFVPK